MAMYDNEPTVMGQGRPSATLVIRQGPQAGMSFPLSGNQITIGREEGLEISLQDPEASRRHARITWQAGQFVIEDLSSTNGTFVNGVQITSPQILNAGDSVGIGQTALVFQVASAAQRQAASPQYQPQSQYAPPPPPAEPPSSSSQPAIGNNSQLIQYALYGCGCLLLLAICALLAVAVWAVLNPDIINDMLSLGVVYPYFLI